MRPNPSSHPRPARRRRVIPATVAALVVAAGLTSCELAVNADGPVAADGPPQQGGTLQVGVTVDFVPKAMFTNSNDTINLLIGQVYDSLVDYPADGLDPEPSLATGWRTTDDGRRTVLDLRRGVTFHDGAAFTSEDVAFSIETWADPAWTVQFQRTAAAVTDVDTSDPHRVVLESKEPVGNLMDLLDVMPILDEDSFDAEATGETYVGTGPFEFSGWTPGSLMTFERNDDYWGGAPYLDGVDVHVVPDAQSLVSQVRSGQLDTILGMGNRDAESLEASGGFTAYPFEGSERQYYVGANVANPDVDDVRLRRAIAYAVDKQRIVDDVFRGVGYASSLPWPEYSPAYDEALDQTYDRDVDRAEQLVDELEAEGGGLPTLPLEYSTANPNNEAIAQIVQSNLADVGIEVTLQPNESAEHIERLINGEFTALWINDHAYAQYQPSTLAVTAYPFNADKNSSNFTDPDYQEDAVAAWQQPDPQSPAAVRSYRALSEDLLEELFLVELTTTYLQAVVGSQVQDLAWTKRSEPVLARTWLAD